MSSVQDFGVTVSPAARAAIRHEFHHLRTHWWWFALLGLLLVICGSVAIVYPFISTFFFIDVLGILFLVAGAATIISAFWAGRWSGLLVQLLIGLLYLAAGLACNEHPENAAAVITFFIATAFILGGAFRALGAVLLQFPMWGWALLNGVITLLAGFIIIRHWPASLVVLGLLVGIEMLFCGWTWLMLAFAIRSLPEIRQPA